MVKDTSISIRMDSKLKEQTEVILEQFGLNMTVVVNMLFHHIVREREIPLPLTLNKPPGVSDELALAKKQREDGFRGRSAETVANDMAKIVAEAETKYAK